jgi:hypothetical protein
MPIPGPHHDRRPGAAGAATARLVIVAMLCGAQYWLLTSTMEASHAGDREIPIPAAIASGICFLLAAGLILTGEIGSFRGGAPWRQRWKAR